MKHLTTSEELTERSALFSLGAMSQHEASSFVEHLREGCEACRAELESFEPVVRTLSVAAPEAVPSPETRTKLMTLLDGVERPVKRSSRGDRQGALRDFLTIRAGEGEWTLAGEGVLVKRLFSDPARGTVTSLFKLAPGTRCDSHRHFGVEECLVLEGEFQINEQVLCAGDYHCAMPGTVDETLYTVSGATILIVGAEKYLPV